MITQPEKPGEAHRATAGRVFLTGLMLVASMSGCGSPANNPEDVTHVSGEHVKSGSADTGRLFTSENEGRDWPSYGGLYDEQHYSMLAQINQDTVGELGLEWSFDLPPVAGPATAPLAVDGVVYLSYGLSVVYALDAVTGEELWRYDPDVPGATNDKLKTSWGIRGMAYWDGAVYTGTQDGRLIALEARTGKLLWSHQTIEPDDGRFISGPPRAFDGKIIIGHGGADVAQIRGYVTTYDARTGEQLWRFDTVPGNPADGFENNAMAMAAATWKGEWWRFGGGGTVWNAMTYDPEFDRIYIGTGNGQPWNQKIRSPGGGDNLFLCSIVALDARTGEYVWHYQTNPGETWDYNSAMDMTLADVEIEGETRQVILHAPKNGFFYVIDREDGSLISAEKIVPHITWASRIDIETGRPIELPDARYPDGETTLWPYAGGAHNWYAQSYSPRTGLVYIPTMDLPMVYNDIGVDHENWTPRRNTLIDSGLSLESNPQDRNKAGSDKSVPGSPSPEDAEGASLQAWDPVQQRQVWSIRQTGVTNAGTMATAGDLVFQGWGDGYLYAYAADTGEVLWKHFAGAGIMAQPISFERDGTQYITVVAAYGGIAAALGEASAQFGWGDYRGQNRRVLTFALEGNAELPPSEPSFVKPLKEPRLEPNPAMEAHGASIFADSCASCHGFGAIVGGTAPDLRASYIPADAKIFESVVRDGIMQPNGMPRFDEYSAEDVEAIRHYIRAQAGK